MTAARISGGAWGALALAAVAGLACTTPRASAASAASPLPPRGPHPRIALTPAVRASLKGKLGSPGVEAALAACAKAKTSAGAPDGYQGDAWAFPASACALAWQLTGDADAAAKGVRLWRALLEDVAHIGDGKACVAGASPKQAIASIQRDTGYAIRFVGPHAALAYDWLHDAPGVDEGLRKQSRDCFRAWLDWYGKDGYLHTQPGANYHAGYVFAKTLVAIAEAGEDGATSDRYWREAIDELFGAEIVGNGLAADNHGVPRGARHGALVGGGWPEGWQYGPLSVVEYAFAARALEEQGARWPELHAWADDLTLRFLHGLAPGRDGVFAGGDAEDAGAYLPTSGGPLWATLIGPGGDRAAGWAAFVRDKLGVRHFGPPVFDALVEARAVTPIDPWATATAHWFLARGTRAVYARSDFGEGAFWAVFTSPPRLVDDHQHPDASNFVFSRGRDALVVDPSPYGSRSTLTSNALSVDSDVVMADYKPSQTFWSEAELPWARATRSRIVAARADVARAFNFSETPSDVPLARRDWVFLPEGELVMIDRALTGGFARNMYLRFRTPATLTLAPDARHAGMFLARGAVGDSALAIHDVLTWPAATPTVTAVPKGGDCGKQFGACTVARIPVNDYALKIAGAETLAVHVLDALGRSEAPAEVEAVGGAPAVVGARVVRGGKTTFVVTAARARAAPPETLAYKVSGAAAARHVVFDAPEDGTGRASVKATPAGGRCAISLAASGGPMLRGRPLIFDVAPASAGCTIGEETDQPSDGVAGR